MVSSMLHSVMQPMFWFQPTFYALHGWLATEMALWMLFHPYEPKYLIGTQIQLPLTPGIFPRGRHKLSIAIANTITEILLTQDDIKRQAQKLITEDNIYKSLDMLFSSVGQELRDIQHIQRIQRYIGEFLPPFIQKLADDYIGALERGENKAFQGFTQQLFNHILPRFKLDEPQAQTLSTAMFSLVMTPATVRQFLVKALTDENIEVFEEAIRARVTGLQGFLFKFVDLKKGFVQFRTFLAEEPDDAHVFLGQIMDRLQLQEKLTEQLCRFSFLNFPAETLEELKAGCTQSLQNLLVHNRVLISQSLQDKSRGATQAITHSLMQMDYGAFTENFLPGFKRDLARFTYTYLHKELENMLSKALPAISLNTVIMEKIDQFSARELEETIQRICHRELRWLAFLGAFLGFWLGIVSNVLSAWIH